MNSKKSILRKRLLMPFILGWIFIISSMVDASHPNIFLFDKDFNEINPITGENDDQPFSTKVTCGLCHDYDIITSGYHFQHGWDVISDTFGISRGKPWQLSPRMMGGWSPPSFRQLAKKNNAHPDEIDLTAYDFIGNSSIGIQPSCGACHAGGGGMEFDREGNRYDEHLAENPELSETYDGDYYRSEWDKSGVVEADCFICHLVGYDFTSRVEQLEYRNYEWAVVAGSRYGVIEGQVKYGDEPKVVYNTKYFNADGSISIDPSWPPPDDNCMFCHGASDSRKRGFSWNDIFNPDIHNQQGISCAACHPSGLDHQFAMGVADRAEPAGHIAHTMTECKECHEAGFLGALIPQHITVRPSHLRRITCEACHIPQLGRAAMQGYDVSTGDLETWTVPDSVERIGERARWEPNFHRKQNKNIVPSNDMLGVFWGNIDSDGYIYILFMKEHEQAWDLYSDQIEDDNDDGEPEVNTEAEIIAGLNAFKETLADNQRFSQVKPVYLKGNKVYGFDAEGKLAILDEYEFETIFRYELHHNTAPARLALGYHGCADCHAPEAHFFKGELIKDPFDQYGKPVMALMGKELGCNRIAFDINAIHQKILSPIVSFLIIFVIFMVTLHYHRFGPKRIPFVYGSGEVKRFSFLERAVHLFRLISFAFLALTGLIMAFNWYSWQNLLFASPKQMLDVHIYMGIVFGVTTIMGIGLWSRDALFKAYDKVWMKMSGGYLGAKGEVPAGRFNAGQKMFYWFTTIFGVLIIITGILLIIKYQFQLSTICLVSTIHNLIAFILIAGVLAHAYLGTIANPGTWRVLVDGYVTKTWAKHHHPNWYQEVVKSKKQDIREEMSEAQTEGLPEEEIKKEESEDGDDSEEEK
ncbi:MAG TPA: formate dehydrogenase subunit gamma [candidate division Zixibacteria bacterium]|nr:formate dehydrogenase subunit gamma [candidate division Zixibacteria bacterium]HEQ98560.1 formate dehydrogenase subunit gamma [candidate division Zixibacteria bacterium]